MKNILELDFGIVKILPDNILISELNEGILFNVDSNRQLLEIGAEAFQGKNYGYISHRIHSYAVDPMVYKESAEYSALKAIAVVSPRDIGRRSAQVERSFYKDKNRFEIFSSFEEAIAWVKNSLNSVNHPLET